jgi:hypothetical protein
MKKLLLAFAILGFVACGGGEKTETTDSTTVAPAETPAVDSTAVVADSSATDSTAAKADSAK